MKLWESGHPLGQNPAKFLSDEMLSPCLPSAVWLVLTALRAGLALTRWEEISPANTTHAAGAHASIKLQVKMPSQPAQILVTCEKKRLWDVSHLRCKQPCSFSKKEQENDAKIKAEELLIVNFWEICTYFSLCCACVYTNTWILMHSEFVCCGWF